MGLFFGNHDDDVVFDGGLHDTLEAESKSKLYTTLMWVSIAGIFITIALLVLGVTKAIALSSTIILLICIVLIICAGILISLPWVRHFQKKEFKIPSIVFLSLNALTVVLWVVCAFLIWNMYKGSQAGQDIFQYTKSLTTFQISFVITLQTLVATVIGTSFLKYKKKWLPLQVVIYIAYAFIDFYVTFAICCLRFKQGDEWLEVSNAGINFVTNKVILVLLSLAILYAVIANSMIIRTQKKRVRRSMFRRMSDRAAEEPAPAAAPAAPAKSAKERIEELKKMLDDGLITEEEFQTKKEEILKDM